MSFDLNILAKGTSKAIRLMDQVNGTMVEIHCKGGLMNRWTVQNEGQALELILGNEGEGDFEKNGFRSGKMSPFSCRIDGGKYQIDSQSYKFKKFYLGEHALHGLMYDAAFSILSTELHHDYAQVILTSSYQGADPGYPFSYEIQIQWNLFKDNLIGIKTTIVNLSNVVIPLMDGWHPYFTLGGPVDQYQLEFQSNSKLLMRDDLIPSGAFKHENHFQDGSIIGKIHLDDCFLLDPIQNKIMLSYAGNSITVTPIHNYPYLQLYIPDDRKSIAIENLSGAPDCFNNKMGLQQLEPQAQIYFETTYQFTTTSQP
jgi:aldose 1-epimerase